MNGYDFVTLLIPALKAIGFNMEYFPADDEMVEMWQYDGYDYGRDLSIQVTWNIGRCDVHIDGEDSYHFGGLAPEASTIQDIINHLT
jgi:hypothetical protein